MANVKFLRGLQNNVPVLSGATEGAFYVTTDTHRLYVGNSSGGADLLSQAVRTLTYAEMTALPAGEKKKGQFWYISDRNVLATYDEDKSQFVQINPDTITTIEDLKWSASGSTITPTVISNVGEDTGVEKAGKTVTYTGAKGISTAAAVDANGNATVTITGSEYALGAETSIVDDKVQKQTYKITKDGVPVSDSDLISLVPGNNISFEVANGELTIVGAAAEDLEILKSVTVSAIAAGYKIVIAENGDNEVETTFDPVIKIGQTEQQVHFVNGFADLDVYTIDEIERKLQALNAMIYKGAISSLPVASAQEIGFMYKASNDIHNVPIKSGSSISSSGEAKKGDILIANSIDDSEVSGKISSGNLYYDIITAGDDIDTQYELKALTNGGVGAELHSTSGDDAITGSLEIKAAADNWIEVNGTGSGTNTRIANIAHKELDSTAVATADSSKNKTVEAGTDTFTAVTGITVDDAGHTTGWKTSTFTVTDTTLNGSDSTVTFDGSVTNNVATLSLDMKLVDTSGASIEKSENVQLQSSSLTFAAGSGTGNVAIDLVWGTF